MKKMLQFYIGAGFILVMMLSSCDPVVVFTSPQPDDVPFRSFFDPSFQGSFLCESDSSLVVVDSQSIYKKEWVSFTLPKSKIDTSENMIMVGEYLYLKGEQKCLIYKIKSDTVYASLPVMDTLFSINDVTHILKSYRGYQILNIQLNDNINRWEVIILSLDEYANIKMDMATLPQDVMELRAVTPVEDISREDVEQYLINPTLVEFDQILDYKIVFETCDYFKRVNPPIQ